MKTLIRIEKVGKEQQPKTIGPVTLSGSYRPGDTLRYLNKINGRDYRLNIDEVIHDITIESSGKIAELAIINASLE